MNEPEQERLYEFTIPENIMESKRVFGYRTRNWIEGLICVGIAGFIILQIPFVLRVKIIFLICICAPILLINLIGIRDQSIFEMISNFHVAKGNKGEYHLRKPNDEEHCKSRKMSQSYNGIGNGESAADKLGDLIKGKIAEFKEKRH